MKEELGIKKIDDYYKYRVNIEKVKILKLNNVASFVKKYGYIENKYILIDWSKVAKIYDGIYISNEVIEKNKTRKIRKFKESVQSEDSMKKITNEFSNKDSLLF